MEIQRLLPVVTLAFLAACGGEPAEPGDDSATEPVLTAANLGEQTILEVDEYLADERYVSADRATGARQAQICRACHSLDKGGANMIGPALYGFFGREVGAVEGFAYSPSLSNAAFTWTPRAMDAWLAEPAKFLPGNRMTVAGVQNQQDRDALIAYLLEETTK